MAGALELCVPEVLERVLERSGYLEALEAERTVEAQGRIENLLELVGVAREYQARAEEPACPSSSSNSPCIRTRTTSPPSAAASR